MDVPTPAREAARGLGGAAALGGEALMPNPIHYVFHELRQLMLDGHVGGGAGGDTMHLRVRWRGQRLDYRMVPPVNGTEGEHLTMPMPHSFWRAFSPTEERLIGAASEAWQTAARLCEQAGLVGEVNERDVSVILRNLVDRDVLESAQGKGYRLKTSGTSEHNGADPPPS